ncbi:MAG TPA: hypothetical protein VHS36_10250 [Candidatus Limnocylindrales bacterium]|jgi:hypothetical protein|nr:hypothetical protein [Candidatus Limnocylindrales bacterium]
MVIFSALLTFFGRMIGAAATMTIAWGTILLFGRVPQSTRSLLSFITLGSLAWVAALAGVVVPAIGSFFIAAIPRTDLLPTTLLRAGMLLLAIFLPLAIGLATVSFVEPKARPVGRDRFTEALRGYPYAATYAITIIFLAIWSLARKIRSLQRGWESTHIPMIVKAGRYEEVAGELEAALVKAGLPVKRKRAASYLRLPVWLIASVGGRKVEGSIPKNLAEFEADDLDILVYPSDVAILGRADLVSVARAAVARRVAFAEAYLTSTMESQQVEDRLREIDRQPKVSPRDFEPIDQLLTTLDAAYDEWETLYRLRLQVEQERRLRDSTAPAEAA